MPEHPRRNGMARIAHLVRPSAALAVCVVVALAGSFVIADEDSVTLNGEIEVAEYDDDGNAASVMVYDSEWGEVLVSKEGKGKELLNHVGAVAEVTGTIVELDDDSGYSYAIQVTGYTIEEPAEPEDDPDLDPEE
jgi:hypothetical protein